MEKIQKNLYIKINPFNLITSFILIINLSIFKCQCEYDKPIYKDSSCQLVYCTKNQYCVSYFVLECTPLLWNLALWIL